MTVQEMSNTPVPPSEGSRGDDLQAAATIDYRSELVRKAIHLCSLSIPVIYFLVSKETALLLLLPVTALFLIADIARLYSDPVAALFQRVFGWLLRRHEQDKQTKRLNGATMVLLSAVLCVLVFPKLITVTAFAILIISDSTAALVGRKYGKRRFFRKSLVGATAFFVSAVAVVAVSPKAGGFAAEYVIGVFGAAVGAVVESASIMDDNFSVPVSIGVVMWALYALFLPGLDLAGPVPFLR